MPPPDTFDSATQTAGSMEVQHSTLKGIQFVDNRSTGLIVFIASNVLVLHMYVHAPSIISNIMNTIEILKCLGLGNFRSFLRTIGLHITNASKDLFNPPRLHFYLSTMCITTHLY